jgi:hypothetical protein
MTHALDANATDCTRFIDPTAGEINKSDPASWHEKSSYANTANRGFGVAWWHRIICLVIVRCWPAWGIRERCTRAKFSCRFPKKSETCEVPEKGSVNCVLEKVIELQALFMVFPSEEEKKIENFMILCYIIKPPFNTRCERKMKKSL